MALSPDLIEAVEFVNQEYASTSDKELEKLDQQWIDEDPAAEPAVNRILKNPLSDRFRVYMQTFPENVEIFVTGTRGFNIAMSARMGDFIQAGEGWWDASYAGGAGTTFIDDVEFDSSTNVYAINIATPIRDGSKVVGILRTTVDVSQAFQLLSEIQIGETGTATLIDRNGTILYERNPEWLMQLAPDWMSSMITEEDSGWFIDMQDLGGNPAVLAYHKLTGENAEQLGWAVVMNQDLTELNQASSSLMRNNIIISFILLVILSGAGIWMANDITRPLGLLTIGTQNIAKGQITQSVDNKVRQKILARGDELGMLAKGISDTEAYFSERTEIAKLISKGNLTSQVELHSEQDILGIAFRQMIHNLREQITNLTNSAEQLSISSEGLASTSTDAGLATGQIAETNQQVASGTNQQASSVEQTATSVE